MIKKYVDGPNAVTSNPVFSTENLDAFLLRAPKGFDTDAHVAFLDTYVFYRRGEEYCTPICAVYAEQCQYADGRVLNRISKCDVGPFGVVPSALANTVRSDEAIAKAFKSRVESNTSECLFGIQEFAGSITLAYVDIDEFATEGRFYELNDRLLLAAVTADQ